MPSGSKMGAPAPGTCDRLDCRQAHSPAFDIGHGLIQVDHGHRDQRVSGPAAVPGDIDPTSVTDYRAASSSFTMMSAGRPGTRHTKRWRRHGLRRRLLRRGPRSALTRMSGRLRLGVVPKQLGILVATQKQFAGVLFVDVADQPPIDRVADQFLESSGEVLNRFRRDAQLLVLLLA